MKFLYIASLFQVLLACNPAKKVSPSNVDCESSYDSLTNQVVYSVVDEMPSYPGGNKEMSNFIFRNFNYPAQDVFQASFKLEFIVTVDGNITGQRIKDKKMEDLTKSEKEFLRVLSIMPKWSPGKCQGKVIPVRTFLPIKF